MFDQYFSITTIERSVIGSEVLAGLFARAQSPSLIMWYFICQGYVILQALDHFFQRYDFRLKQEPSADINSKSKTVTILRILVYRQHFSPLVSRGGVTLRSLAQVTKWPLQYPLHIIYDIESLLGWGKTSCTSKPRKNDSLWLHSETY